MNRAIFNRTIIFFFFFFQMHSGSAIPPTSPAFSVSIGIAALVLEGRPLFDDEYCVEETNIGHRTSFKSISSPTHHYYQQPWSGTAAYHQTPRSGQDSIQHLQRLRQKLHQLRSMPSTSRDRVERMLTVETDSPINNLCDDSDEELEEVFKQQAAGAASNDKKPPLKKPIALTSLQVLAATSVQTTPRSFHQHDGLLKTVESYFPDKFCSPSTSSSSGCSSSTSCMSTPSSSGCTPVLNNAQIAKLKAKAKLVSSVGVDKGLHKIVGPHLDLFLKKVGLIKASGISDQCHEFDEHYCNTAVESVSSSTDFVDVVSVLF